MDFVDVIGLIVGIVGLVVAIIGGGSVKLIVGLVGGSVANAVYSWISGKASVMFARISTVSPIDVAGLVVASAALTVAIIAVVPAFKALAAARSASASADAANRLAREANDLVSGQVARETERHDAHWGWKWAEPGVALVGNKGQDSVAYDVRAALTIDNETVTETASEVAPGGALQLVFPTAYRHFYEEVADLSKSRRPPSRSHPLGGYLPDFEVPDAGLSRLTHSSELHVHWVTDRGAPRELKPEGPNTWTSLGNHEAALDSL